MWNTRDDPIYEPSTGLCYYEHDPGRKFSLQEMIYWLNHKDEVGEQVDPQTQEPEEYHLVQNQNYEISQDGHFDTESNYNPPTTATTSPKFFDGLFVPDKCRGYGRMWDFYIGTPEDLFINEDITGWISRIAFVDNIIQEMGLTTTIEDHYTIIPYNHRGKNGKIERLLRAPSLQIDCPRDRVFHHLFCISQPIDMKFRRSILAVTISYSYDELSEKEMAKIKIIFDPEIGSNHEAFRIFKMLKHLNPYIQYFRPYLF